MFVVESVGWKCTMDITSLIESAKQLSRQYERNAMNAEVVIEKISGFNQDALALQWER